MPKPIHRRHIVQLELPALVACFLDESATDAKDTDHAVLGGIVLNKRELPEFNGLWNDLVGRYGLTKGLHMKELGPKGPYPNLVGDACAAMLADAVGIINRCRIFTFGASADNRRHEQLFSTRMRDEHFSVYGMAFMMAVEINRASAVQHGYRGTIDYVLDEGNQLKRHVVQMHEAIERNSQLRRFQVGHLHFATDTAIPGLQAADVIAWSTRRMKSGKALAGVLSPLQRLFDEHYADSPAPDRPIRKLAKSFARAEMRFNRTGQQLQ